MPDEQTSGSHAAVAHPAGVWKILGPVALSALLSAVATFTATSKDWVTKQEMREYVSREVAGLQQQIARNELAVRELTVQSQGVRLQMERLVATVEERIPPRRSAGRE